MTAAACSDDAVSAIAAAISAPARARMLYSLVDGRARTSTELALVADVSPATASVHLQQLKTQRLVTVFAQGKHRYYSLDGADVAAALEALSVLAGGSRRTAADPTSGIRAARTCYDHIAGALGVALYDRLSALGWIAIAPKGDGHVCDITANGLKGFAALGVDVDAVRALRRRFAYACLDWSERRPHLGGALGAALLDVALRKKWVAQERHSRALTVTTSGRRELYSRFGLRL